MNDDYKYHKTPMLVTNDEFFMTHSFNDNPAIVHHDGTREWYRHGKRHRDCGPAVIHKDHIQYWRDGKLHRDDGPAIEKTCGGKEYFFNGSRHREDGPAVIYESHQSYYIQGKAHRDDGPALTQVMKCFDGSSFNVYTYYVNGILCLDKKDFDEKLKIWKLMEVMK